MIPGPRMNMAKTFRHLFGISMMLIMLHSAHHSFGQLNTDNLTHYTELDGLPGMEVTDILPDRFGYIWVGTINGLARFDGYGFKRFYSNPNDSSSIKGGVVWSLVEDSKGQIWIGTEPQSLNLYNPVTQSFKHYEFGHLVKHTADDELIIPTIIERDSTLYFGAHSKWWSQISSSLLRLDKKQNKIVAVEYDKNLVVSNIAYSVKDNQGNIWLRGGDGLFKLDKTEHLVKIDISGNAPLLDREYLTHMICDKDGHLWIITNYSRLLDLDPATKTYQLYAPIGTAPATSYNQVLFDPSGNIWMGTNMGLYLFDRKKKTVQGFPKDARNNIEGASIEALAYDSFGSLWIGTQNDGLFRYEEKSFFKSYSYDKNKPASLTPGWANNIFELKDGQVLVTTSGVNIVSGLNVLDLQRNTVEPIPYKSLLPELHNIAGMMEDTISDAYYTMTNRGLYKFALHDRSFKKDQIAGLPDTLMYMSFLKDSHGNFWAGSQWGAHRRRPGSSEFEVYDLSKLPGGNTASNMVVKIIESKKHGVWLLTNNGLFLFKHESDQMSRKGFDKKIGDVLVTQDINSFYEEPDGMLWVGTWEGGLSHYNVETGKIKTYTINDGLPSMSIQSILADEKNHYLWLATFEGMSRFHIPSEQFYNYSVADGIQSQLFTDGASLKTSKGLFVFGGSNGITVFDPNQVNHKSIPPKVLLTDLKLFDKSVVPGANSILKKPIYDTDEIELEYIQNNISLEFIALHYSNPAKNKYSYRLENYDNDWREVLNFQAAFYPNLPPGEYTFVVKAANNNGVWNEKGARLKIVVNPPWWNTRIAYVLFALLFGAGIYGAYQYIRHRLVEREREKARTRELEQAKEIEKAYTELKATQAQLIQSEKMASLGELTAGIAHEIQNPLNFVNNFSELSNELVDEMNEEMAKGNYDAAKAITADVRDNLDKILHHGKRAEGIVKGMLQHSRSNSGVKEPTDINALTDEYVRLSYHGLRAKDKSFTAVVSTDFDKSLGKVNVVPQDIGRVILNILTNAFHAVNEKKGTSNYEPTVSINTRKLDKSITITVKDNGSGMPQKVLDKIFQPFFTTKPAGQGTGLGLSISYDIVKAHGGELKVESQPNEGTAFTIVLPASS
ncbi:MAG: two-component regulator propeller domain-containing protein [Chryseolinea sp.]